VAVICPSRPGSKTGLLGAQLVQDSKTKYYKITKLLKGMSWDKELHSPLAEIGVGAAVGDYIIAVNGRPTNEMANIFEALVNTAGKQVKLKLNNKPVAKGSREVTVVPIADEHPLYYYDWVQDNIKKVRDATAGRVGYIHVPDMQKHGLRPFSTVTSKPRLLNHARKHGMVQCRATLPEVKAWNGPCM
jgi:tricorn protease